MHRLLVAAALALALALAWAGNAGAAISLVTNTNTATASTNAASVTIAKPSGIQAGDLLLVAFNYSGSTAPSAIADWTLVQSTSGSGANTIAIYRKVAVAADMVAGNYTFAPYGGTASACATGILHYRGVNRVSPVYATSTWATSSHVSYYTLPSVSVTANGRVVGVPGGNVGRTYGAVTPAAGQPSLTARLTAVTSGPTMQAYDTDTSITTAGTYGTWTVAASNAKPGSGISLALDADDAPVANADSYPATEDATLNVAAAGVLTNDSDPDGDTLSVAAASVVTDQDTSQGGKYTLRADGSFTYVPKANFSGTDTFTYVATDGLLSSSSATVTITVTGVNDAPTVANDSYTTSEDTTLTVTATTGGAAPPGSGYTTGVLANDGDVDGPAPLEAWALIGGAPVGGGLAGGEAIGLDVLPTHGTLTLNTDGSFTYVPHADYYGTDFFTYHAYDHSLYSVDAATVTITVTSVDDAPVAQGDSYSTNINTTLTRAVTTGWPYTAGVLVNDTDVDGPYPLTAVLVTGPSQSASFTLNANGGFSYTPENNYSGPDSFTYRASDGTLTSQITTVSLTVGANTAPTVAPIVLSTTEDHSVAFGGSGSDPDAGQTLTYFATSLPAHGTLSVVEGTETSYTPDENWYGVDTFTYKASDGISESHEALVTITVYAVNDAPIGQSDNYSTPLDRTLTVAAPGVLDDDADVEVGTTVDGSLQTVTITSGTQRSGYSLLYGTLTLTADGSLTYVPTSSGTDTFTYVATDNGKSQWTTTVAGEGGHTAGDWYSDPKTTAEMSVTIVVGANNVPTADGKTISDAVEDTPKLITLSGSKNGDDGQPLYYVISGEPRYGTLKDGSTTISSYPYTLTAQGADVVYTPHTDYCGTDSFTYHTYDGIAESDEANVAITIAPVNDAPIAANDYYSTDINVAVVRTVENAVWPFETGLLSDDTDVDGDALTAVRKTETPEIDTGPSHGTVSVSANGSFTYTPTTNYTGTDSFTYHAYDGHLYSNQATVTITIGSNTPPTANDVSVTTAEDTPKDITLDGTDPNAGQSLTYFISEPPVYGHLSAVDGNQVTYTPDANWHGDDTFYYIVSDGVAQSPAGKVSVTVTSVNDPPKSLSYTVMTDEDTALVFHEIDFPYSDADGDPLVTVQITQLPAAGVLKNDGTTMTEVRDFSAAELAAGKLSFVPAANGNGTAYATFKYKVFDGTVSSAAEYTTTIDVTPVNDAPVAADRSVTTAEDNWVEVTLSSTDVDRSDTPADTLLHYVIDDYPQHGSLSNLDSSNPSHNNIVDNADGKLIYTPNANWNGTDTFTYEAHDSAGHAYSNMATVTITVTSVADDPVPPADNQMAVTGLTGGMEQLIYLEGTNVDGGSLIFSISGLPAHGTLKTTGGQTITSASGSSLYQLSDRSVIYTPTTDYTGPDAFTYGIAKPQGAQALPAKAANAAAADAKGASPADQELGGREAADAGDITVNIVVSQGAPTYAAISAFAARQHRGHVVLSWQAHESGTAGYYVERLRPATGRWIAVNRALLPALLEAPGGASYALVDSAARAGRPLTYRIIEVQFNGVRTVCGQFTVSAAGRRLPARLGAQLEHGVARVALNSGSKALAKPAVQAAQPRVTAAAASSLRIETTVKGLYRVTTAQIATGLGRTETDVRNLLSTGGLALSSQSRTIAWTTPTDRSCLLFWAEALDSQYATANVYWLRVAKGARMASAAALRASGTARTSFPETLAYERDLMAATALFTDPAADYWGWDYLIAGSATASSKRFSLEAPAVVAGTSVEVGLRGLTSSGVTNEHHLQVRLNGTLLGETRWTATQARRLTLVLPAGLLVSGTNQLELTAVKDVGVDFSLIMLDAISLSYQRGTVAVADQLAFREPSTGLVTVSGLSSTGALILDLADPRLPQLARASTTGTSGSGKWVRVAVAGGRDYAVAAVAGAFAPRAVTPVAAGTLKAATRGADYLVITHPSLLGAANRLAAYRAGQGLTAGVVTTTEIYDEFNYGVPGPQAIKAFLTYVRTNWKPVPRYVVLAGEGSYDYRNTMGYNESLVPPLMVSTEYGLASSDVALADVSGADGVPEFAIGRISGTTEQQLDNYLTKIKAYEGASGSWRTRALFVADDGDPDAGDFAACSAALAARLPSSLSSSQLNLLAPYTQKQVHDGILAAFGPAETDGDLLVNYVGHGGATQLATEKLLSTNDVPGLANSPRLPIFTAFTCAVGSYALPGSEGLSEALVEKAGGGAVAAYAPSALENNDESMVLANGFMDLTFGGARSIILGERLLAAVQQAAASGAKATLLTTYNLLGDPALKVAW